MLDGLGRYLAELLGGLGWSPVLPMHNFWLGLDSSQAVSLQVCWVVQTKGQNIDFPVPGLVGVVC